MTGPDPAAAPRRTLLSQQQIHECLRVAGVGVPADDEMPRAVALGMLLFVVEGAALLDNDRLDHEDLRTGVYSGIASVVAGGDLAGRDQYAHMTELWSHLLRARVNRTALDMKASSAGHPETSYTIAPAMNALMDAVAALLDTNTATTPVPEDQRAAAELISPGLEEARRQIRTARAHVEDGRRMVADTLNPDRNRKPKR